MSVLAEIIVVASALFFIWLAAAVFTAPAFASRFLTAFASSARTHYTEQIARLLFSASLIALSPAMWNAGMFRVIGWAIFVSSLVLILVPWRWHHRLGERIRPGLIRHLRLYAAGSFLFGILLLYGVSAPR
ncbi:MAG TPA: hypothetical protein VFJ90_01080 [Candidatus Didemnitutus sp.]|nr:hypothetical protein [Candidatus Didemnitutus sp.]